MKPAYHASILLGFLLTMPAPFAHAQDYPARQVTFVMPFAPGGAIDLCARYLAQKLTDRLGKPFVVENRPGAGTVIASNMVAKAAPDGHTILVAPSPLATNATLYKQLPYDPAKDFAPIARVADIPFVLVVHPSLPVRTVPELIQYAKARPGQLSYASSGSGTTLHLAGELFKSMTGVQMTHVPYRGSPPALNDVVAGHVNLMFADPASAVAQIREGRVRALGVTSLTRMPTAPDIPPIAEAGLPGFEAVSWTLFTAPAATPQAVINKLHAELKAIVASPEGQKQIIGFGMLPFNTPSPAELKGFLQSEIVRWGKVAAGRHCRIGIDRRVRSLKSLAFPNWLRFGQNGRCGFTSRHDEPSIGLMLRSVAQQRVSKHVAAPSFETALRASSGRGRIEATHFSPRPIHAYPFNFQTANASLAPCCCAGARAGPYSGIFIPLENEGSGAPQGAWPGFEPDRPG